MNGTVHIGIQLSSANATWEDLREHALLVERLGFDSLWVPDHLLTYYAPDGPYLEAWTVLGALGQVTSRVLLGAMVSPITFRHPAVIAKMAAALDHTTGGRAILGLGTGWFEREHTQLGLPYGSPGERVAQLEESAAIARSLFAERRSTYAGTHFALRNATAEPKPLQRRLPILVGGSGPRVLGVVGRQADWWNAFGSPEEMARMLADVRRHAIAAKRDPDAIVPSVTFRPVIVRDRPEEIEARLREVVARQRMPEADTRWMVAGRPDEVAARFAAYLPVGIRTFVVQMHTPYDRETLERLAGEVRPLLG